MNRDIAFSQISRFDTLYVEDHKNDFAIRVFGGTSFSGYKLSQKGFSGPLTYKSNDNFNIGLGFNYRFISLSLGVKAPFVNNDNDRFGNTTMFDLQLFIYLRKFTIDVYTRIYDGYYVKNSDLFASYVPGDNYRIRGDLHTKALGVNAHYIFNYKRFSYRAAYVQNAYQLKSAGSPIAGIGIHHFDISADSAIIPPAPIIDQGFFDNGRFNKSQVFNVSVNGGYVHTVVIHKHFFISGALIAGVGFNITSMTDEKIDTKDRKSGVLLNGTLRLACGYNSSVYFAGIQYIDFLSRSAAPVSGSWQEFEAGTFRLTLGKRFGVKRNIIKEVYEKVIEK